jgi:aspartate aminotransferase
MSTSPWANFEMAPLDPIIGLNESFQKDDFPQKVIVGVGAYRDDQGKPFVLPSVREAEKILLEKDLDMEYAGIVSVSIEQRVFGNLVICIFPSHNLAMFFA